MRTLTAYKETIWDVIIQYRGLMFDKSDNNLLGESGSVVDAGELHSGDSTGDS
jgi:hypothetical protein